MVHDYAYLLHSSIAVAAVCVLLSGTVLVRQVGRSCSIVNINLMQVTDLPHCAIAKLTVCMCMAELQGGLAGNNLLLTEFPCVSSPARSRKTGPIAVYSVITLPIKAQALYQR